MNKPLKSSSVEFSFLYSSVSKKPPLWVVHIPSRNPVAEELKFNFHETCQERSHRLRIDYEIIQLHLHKLGNSRIGFIMLCPTETRSDG